MARQLLKRKPQAQKQLLHAAMPKGYSRVAEFMKKVPAASVKATFASVGGLEFQMKFLKDCVMRPLQNPEFLKSAVPRGILLSGPPGTGKSLSVRALIGGLRTEGVNVSFFFRGAVEFLCKYEGEGEEWLKGLFEAAKASQPSIILLDQIDGLTPGGRISGPYRPLVTTLNDLLEKLHRGNDHVIVIATTNRPDLVYDGLLGPERFTTLSYL